jgi:hypothetical protein
VILGIVVGFFLVSAGIGFGLGWYVSGAYPRKERKK